MITFCKYVYREEKERKKENKFEIVTHFDKRLLADTILSTAIMTERVFFFFMRLSSVLWCFNSSPSSYFNKNF